MGERLPQDGLALGIVTEAASLRWLDVDDGAPVAQVLDVGDTWLVTRRLDRAPATTSAAAEFGRRLALTHAAGAPHFGAPPPGLDGDGDLAGVPLPMDIAERTRRWGEFYARARLEPYVRIAREHGRMSGSQADAVGQVCERLASGMFDAPQPEGCPAVARVHGDLWGGNIFWARGPDGESVGVLIDPAAHGGHAETDLAALAVFGSPHLAYTWAGYDEVAPRADGWQERLRLHQLHMLVVHAALFGGGYGAQAADVARGYR